MSCPCTFLEKPCMPECSCKNGFSSAGCLYCCSYGSHEQRKNMALQIQERMESNVWKDYNQDDKSTHPKKYGKYFIKRKDGKVHWEVWNGLAWAYNNDVIVKYANII